MNKKQKFGMGVAVVLGTLATPSMIAHADEGVVTKDFSITDKEGKVVKEYKSNEVIRIEGETDTSYQVQIENHVYEVNKSDVLKTIKHVEESIRVTQEEITLKSSPDYFGDVILHLEKDEIVYRVGETKNGFVKVKNTQNVEGWVLSKALKSNIKNEPITTKAFIDDDSVKSKSLDYGEAISIVGFENNQYKVLVKDNTVLVNKSAISFTEPPKRVVKTAKVQGQKARSSASSHNLSLSDRVIDKAYDYLGVPYVWGGTTPNGFDCSGYIQYVLRTQGVYVPRVASDQANVGQTVQKSELKKGDLVFFTTYKAGPSHVGFYIGNGQFIHAGGDRVQVSNLNQSYWAERYLFAKRVF